MAKHIIKLKPDNSMEPKRLYANFIQLMRSPFDLTIRFCDATPIDDMDVVKNNEYIHNIPVVADVVVPFNIIPSLIDTLKKEIEKGNKNDSGDQP